MVLHYLRRHRYIIRLVYVSPDGEYKIISEKLSGWSYNIPKLYLLKMDSTKQFEVQFEFSEKIAYRYRNFYLFEME